MMWKIFFVACLAVAALAQYELTEDRKTTIRAALTELCKKNHAEDKAGEVEAAVIAFADSMKTLINPDTIKKEIEDAKPNGALDEVFKKYCNKAPEFKSALHTLGTKMSLCLDQNSRDRMPQAQNATDQLIDFVCYKDGDRIALFIAEGGPECFMSKSNGIRTCADNLRKDVTTVDQVKNMTLTEQCTKYDQLSTCVVKQLEECSTPTPGNMAEALFKFIRKGSPCNTA